MNDKKIIYLDNACTSFPKPESVSNAMCDFIKNKGVNISRSSYSLSFDALDMVYNTRKKLNDLFNGDSPNNVVFTKNITESLNIIIKGYVYKKNENKTNKKIHILTSSLEHNSVMRPLHDLKNENLIDFDRIPCDEYGALLIDEIEKMINPNTELLIIQHASNVIGIINPLFEIGQICIKHNVNLIIDSAQSAGLLDIDMKKFNIKALCFTGHKSLLGPQGVGGFLLTNEMVPKIKNLFSGGTGSISNSEEQPSFMPDKFESGTMNIPNIIGLYEGISFIEKIGKENILNKEQELFHHFLDGLYKLDKKIKIHGINKNLINDNTMHNLAVISISSLTMDNAKLSYILANEYNILTRVGLHCAPNAHKMLYTFPLGTVRFSIGYFNTFDDINKTLLALSEIE
ncbi:MAG: aminotransferase class V-fold PLP-dependent enzyme [Eubacteriales bacterium]|nr:aminotransferase class V-fold PLP-dependent enzyme [Eubacteriales bacterium]